MMKNLISLIALILMIFFSACLNDRTPEEVADAISKSAALKRIDNLCTKLPKPDNFHFVEKQFGGNTVLAVLVFHYQSSQKSSVVQDFYKKWAQENGWNVIEDDRYTKGNQTIVLENETFDDSNFEITCEETR